MTRDPVDFHAVEAKHATIHARLENWGMWCQPGRGRKCSPTFSLYISPARARFGHDIDERPIVDPLDAQRIAKAIGNPSFPQLHRQALQWAYVWPWVKPKQICRKLATTEAGLWQLVRDGRVMLVNRRA